ncbi:MAG: hypothetical protein H0W30_02675 [Gemmatimonadaceae bacterium]|nr:hypothetical protein [Gemmatimonadaceae bacterium]
MLLDEQRDLVVGHSRQQGQDEIARCQSDQGHICQHTNDDYRCVVEPEALYPERGGEQHDQCGAKYDRRATDRARETPLGPHTPNEPRELVMGRGKSKCCSHCHDLPRSGCVIRPRRAATTC